MSTHRDNAWLAEHNSGVLWMYLLPGLTGEILVEAARDLGMNPEMEKPRQMSDSAMRALKEECMKRCGRE